MIDLVGFSLITLILMVQNRPAPQRPAFEMAKDESSITFSTVADLKVIFSSPEFHAHINPAAPWEAGWTRVEVLHAGKKFLCEEGRKHKPPMGYQPAIDGGRGFSPDGKYLTIFVYDTVGPDGSDGKGYFTFLDLMNCQRINFKSEHEIADPSGGYWKSGDPHTYMMIDDDGEWHESHPGRDAAKPGTRQN